MNAYYFSASENGFMPGDKKEIYINAGSWPSDAIEVNADVFEKFSANPPDGYVLGVENGMPAFVALPPPTAEELKLTAELRKAQLRNSADSEIAWQQDAIDVGIATDEEAAELSEWKKYRVLLMRVDTAAPVWPTPPERQG